MNRFIKFLTIFCLVIFCQQVFADKITNLRAFSNADKTRVVVDLDFKPQYSTDFSKDGKSFVVRIKNVDNYKTAKSNLSFESRSAVKKLQKKLDAKDVRYVFTLNGSGQPNVFILAPQSNYNYRLVIDFPHTATNRDKSSYNAVKVIDQSTANKLKGTGGGSGIPPVSVITVHEADNAEQALLNSLSSVGKDGLRTMTPQQAATYAQKKKEMERLKALNKKEPEVVADTNAPPPPSINYKTTHDPFIIAVDAGHGGKDPGAIGKRGVREKNVTLSISLELSRYINSNSKFKAVLIRSKDVFVELNKRSEIARAHKADLLISIHADSVASGNSARGVSVWVLSNNRAVRENKKLLGQDNKSTLLGGAGEVLSQADQNPYLAATILDMSSDVARSHGYQLGQEILDKLGKFTRVHRKTPIHASLAVLTSPDIPSLLIETGFLSNQYEEIQLNQPNYQKQIAYSIYQGIKSYYEKYPAQMLQSRQDSAMRAQNKEKLHIVKKGEYLAKIAKNYGISISALRSRNALKSDVLKIGQELIIPK